MLGLAWRQLSGCPSPSQLTAPGFVFKWEDWPRGSFKRWDFNPQFYSDSLSIGLTFPSNSPFLRQYTVTLHFASTPTEHNARRCECARDIDTRQSPHFVMSSESLMKSEHRKSWQSENQGRAQPLGRPRMPAGPHVGRPRSPLSQSAHPGSWRPRRPAIWGEGAALSRWGSEECEKWGRNQTRRETLELRLRFVFWKQQCLVYNKP